MIDVPGQFARECYAEFMTIAEAFKQDRRDRRSKDHFLRHSKIVQKRDSLRRALVYRLIRAERLKRRSDLLRAAYILHHSGNIRDVAMGHLLSTTAFSMGQIRPISNINAYVLLKQTEDRFLVLLGLPQKTGTQFRLDTGRKYPRRKMRR
jgi:hypothetical protein